MRKEDKKKIKYVTLELEKADQNFKLPFKNINNLKSNQCRNENRLENLDKCGAYE